MSKIALVILSSTENPEAHGRLIHAVQDGKALKDGDHDVILVFEGIGVTWLQAFYAKEHPVAKAYAAEFEYLQPNILGACNFCVTKRFQVQTEVNALGIRLLGGDGHHFNISTLIADGYQIINY